MRVRKSRRQTWNLSFASMSDIAFLLIIFFMVAGKFNQTEAEVPLPAASLGEKTQPRKNSILVTKEGQYYLNSTRISNPEDLAEQLGSLFTEETSVDQRTVTVYADRDAAYGAVSKAIYAVNDADAYLELAVRFTK